MKNLLQDTHSQLLPNFQPETPSTGLKLIKMQSDHLTEPLFSPTLISHNHLCSTAMLHKKVKAVLYQVQVQVFICQMHRKTESDWALKFLGQDTVQQTTIA